MRRFLAPGALREAPGDHHQRPAPLDKAIASLRTIGVKRSLALADALQAPSRNATWGG